MRVPRHEPGPPETLTDSDYANLLRVPDRSTLAGKRDYARLRVLGDCGLRSADELRGLRARDLGRPRANRPALSGRRASLPDALSTMSWLLVAGCCSRDALGRRGPSIWEVTRCAVGVRKPSCMRAGTADAGCRDRRPKPVSEINVAVLVRRTMVDSRRAAARDAHGARASRPVYRDSDSV